MNRKNGATDALARPRPGKERPIRDTPNLWKILWMRRVRIVTNQNRLGGRRLAEPAKFLLTLCF